ncbi:MAG: pentapeptide repeat-containing protein [Dolichospermum sp. LBC05a]|nr:pentapeptide repeat-containing protein [Dolichospermum sp. OL01]MCO5796850.1 pentapeptide repeat-containing protein [Dolichospermum sp. OL03]MCS6282985.1 pentapeptide repeat-containing protein [Dolichospermum sp.]QSV58427.1 MAG: pentapeptide repeat-containing protein [Dolichospermum sp. LBC05a]
MPNEKQVRILYRGTAAWNRWREKYPGIKPDLFDSQLSHIDLSLADLSNADLSNADLGETNLSSANLSEANLRGAILSRADLSNTNLRGAILTDADLTDAHLSDAYLIGAYFSNAVLIGTDLSNADLSNADLSEADLSEANLRGVDLTEANLRGANLSNANLSNADLSEADLTEANLRGANLSNANLRGLNLIRSQALETNFTSATLTEACIEDWNTNSDTKLDDVICEYIYLQEHQKERRPSSGNFAPVEFTKLYQKSLDTIDLIFRHGIDWDAFAYSFRKIEVENQGAKLDIQSIEKKGNGVLVVRINASLDADKTKIHGDFIQGYEFAHKTLEAQYQTRLEDKNLLIAKQETHINRLFDIIDKQGVVQQVLADNPRKVSNYDFRNSQIAGGILDAQTVNAEQIGGEIQN